jgi:3-oxoacyl-[acyl-carrier protein] reductase
LARAAPTGGPVDVLLNNAGTYDQLTWREATADVRARTYNVNVISGVVGPGAIMGLWSTPTRTPEF